MPACRGEPVLAVMAAVVSAVAWVQHGVRNGIKNLVKERKKSGGELVILDKGKIRHVPAKEL